MERRESLEEMGSLQPAFSQHGFFPKAANLTSIVEEKEQSLQESTAAILQKEQEILQLKKGEGPALFLPSTPTLRWPRHEAAWSHWARLPSARPRS